MVVGCVLKGRVVRLAVGGVSIGSGEMRIGNVYNRAEFRWRLESSLRQTNKEAGYREVLDGWALAPPAVALAVT